MKWVAIDDDNNKKKLPQREKVIAEKEKKTSVIIKSIHKCLTHAGFDMSLARSSKVVIAHRTECTYRMAVRVLYICVHACNLYYTVYTQTVCSVWWAVANFDEQAGTLLSDISSHGCTTISPVMDIESRWLSPLSYAWVLLIVELQFNADGLKYITYSMVGSD